jgi:hypothetical protein
VYVGITKQKEGNLKRKSRKCRIVWRKGCLWVYQRKEVKGKIYLITGHEGIEGGVEVSSTFC